MSKVDLLLDQNIEDENYGVSELVSDLGMSRTHLHRKLNSITGKSSSSYIREFRLKKAYTMLLCGTDTASEISYKVGFSSPSYFSTAFKKFYGYSPGEAKLQKDPNQEPVAKNQSFPLWIVFGILFLGLAGLWAYQQVYVKTSLESTLLDGSESKEKTIAVLAFEDLSDDQSERFAGMGLAVEVINILDDVDGLKVIGKTSAFSFLDQNITIDSIAGLLSVNYILEGTISAHDDEKEVFAILTDAASGHTLFSKRYTMGNDDLRFVKREIAKQVAYELKIKVNQDVILSSKQDDARLMAMEQEAYYKMSKQASVKEITGIWDECLSMDSTYIPCIANRSRFHKDSQDHLSYVNRLNELDSTNIYTYFVKGNYFFEEKFDFQNAYLNYKKMLEKNPSDPRVLSEASYRVGFFDIESGLNHLLDAMNKDPLYYKNYYHLAQLYLLKGEYNKSIDLYYEMMRMTGTSFPWPIIFINIYGGYYEEADLALNSYLSDPDPGTSKETLVIMKATKELFMAGAKKQDLEFEKKLAFCIENNLYPFSIASALALYGDFDRSFAWLERGYESKRVRFFEELKYAPWFGNMRKDPRWPVLMKKLRMPGYSDKNIQT